MGFLSVAGRILFASYFLYLAWIQFGAFGTYDDVTTRFGLKFDYLSKYLASNFGVDLSAIDPKYFIAASISLKLFGGILFIVGSTSGAYLLLLHLAIAISFSQDFDHHYKAGFARALVKFSKDLALFGAILIFVGVKNSIHKRHSRRRPSKSRTA